MLPTCIGISGVSRYRNDASIEDSFLASAIFSSRSRKRGALAALLASRMFLLLEHIPKTAAHPASIARRAHSKSCPTSGLWSGLCIFRRPVGNGKRPRPVKMLKFPLGLRQTVGHRPQCGGVDAEPDMAGEMDLDVFGGFRGTQQAGVPVHDPIGTGIDRGRRDRQVTGNCLA